MTTRWFLGLLTLGAALIVTAAALIAAGPTGGALAQPPTPESTFPGDPLPTDRGTYFSGAGACTSCHSNMTDTVTGQDVSLGAFWRSTMMANAARDPYWQASVRVEVDRLPQYEAVIEDKCATCHMPMARFNLHQDGEEALVLGEGLAAPDHPLHTLAMDGVSCTLCHQVQPDDLGEMASFSGHFAIDAETPMGERVAYSPFPVDPQQASIMQAASGFVPTQAEHITQAQLCASCHTLYTPYVNDDEEIVGEFPEQTPYFEWLNSVYAQEGVPCQWCHMARARGPVQTPAIQAPPVFPFYQHVFVGGNAYLQTVFQSFGDEMDATASSEHFDATRQRTLDQLGSITAVLSLDQLKRSGSELTADIAISTRTGHKFPSGFPSRRAWLRVRVTDANGEIIFESGDYDYEAAARVIGDDHDADPATYEPHYTIITSPDQVQIYESVMVDINGAITNILLRGTGYVKDNRLLPHGFDPAAARDEIRVVGAAADDPDFTGGGDTVRYVVDVGDTPGPYTVTAELLYLSISFNWAEKLRPYDSAEAVRFLDYYEAVPNVPVVISQISAQVD